MERLAKADTDNAAVQRDLSISHNYIGDVLLVQGNLPEALAAHKDSLAIRERLAKADPGNTEWQRDLSVSYEKIGGAGHLAEALASYKDNVAIRERLAKAGSDCAMAA
jgi:hypothetical protein